MNQPLLVVSDSKGNIFEIPELLMVGASVNSLSLPDDSSITALPQSSVLFALPKRIPIGYDYISKKRVALDNYHGEPVSAVAAFLPPGYIRTLISANCELPGAPRLPLYCYSAVGWKNGKFYAAGIRIDRQMRHEISDESLSFVDSQAKAMLRRYPCNRLIRHLVENCVCKYRCPNACNLVLGKWECPVPVSPVCNAACIGCISLQARGCGFPASQHRIDFVPTEKEIEEYVVPHLQKAANPIASFGQGCEGEPLLQAGLIKESIKRIRSRTRRGVININTNASLPKAVERICLAGLNSMRVSMNSAQAGFYAAYYRPKSYSFDDVCESIAIAKKHKVWVSLNYLVFPGFTDHPGEVAALKKLLKKTKVDMIQTRNLNIDPQWFITKMGLGSLRGKPIGMVSWVVEMKKYFPDVKLGYFNPTFKTMEN
ncbi:MAG: radical SAM protein [Chitinivibrionales bacterium]